MSNIPNKTNKLGRFLRNNVALLMIIFCVIAIATVVLVVSLTEEPIPVDNPTGNDPGGNPTGPGTNDPGGNQPVYETIQVYFQSPVAYEGVGMGFTDGIEVLFVFNPTLNKWATHYGVNLLAPAGSEVSSMYDGTVIEVGWTYGAGNFVKIDHGNGIVATYASLADQVEVVEGQNVSKGEVIGVTSVSANYAHLDGAHLHIEVVVNDTKTDPMPYVNGDIYFEYERLVEE